MDAGRDPRPVLVVIGGLPAVGKTTIARVLARQVGAAFVRLDSIEQAILRAPTLAQLVGPEGYIVGVAIHGYRLPNGLSGLGGVDDPLAALARLGGFARVRTNAKVVAVTGSVGKTTTKEMLRTVLSAFGQTHAAEASYNNHWGLPLTLARMPRDAAFCVAEIGMRRHGWPPHCACGLTTIWGDAPQPPAGGGGP